MPYLNLELNFEGHPKTRRLIGILGEQADALPVRLWLYCGNFHPKDGRMAGYSVAEVEDIMKWRGEPGAAVAAMVKVRYLKKVGNSYQCVDWLQHEGHLEAFSIRGKKAAAARWAKLSKTPPTSNASGIQEAKQDTPSSNAPTVPTEPSVPSLPALPTEPGQGTVDVQGQLRKKITELALSKLTPGEQERLLALQMPFGERKGARIMDLTPSYCQFILDECVKPTWEKPLGQELQSALALRVMEKAQEVAR